MLALLFPHPLVFSYTLVMMIMIAEDPCHLRHMQRPPLSPVARKLNLAGSSAHDRGSMRSMGGDKPKEGDDFQYHVIRTFNMSSKHVSTLAGVESLDSVFVDGTSRSARFTGPTSVAGDQDPSMQHNTAPVKSKCFPSSALARQPPLLLSPPLTQNDLLSKAEAEAGADLHDETKLSSSSFSSFGDSSESDL